MREVTMSLSFFSRFNACNSSFVKLQSVSEVDCRMEAILLLMSSLIDRFLTRYNIVGWYVLRRNRMFKSVGEYLRFVSI